MRLFEYEAKTLLKGYNIPVPPGMIVHSPDEMKIDKPSVIKAQIPAGGRKKAGGVIFADTQERAQKEASKIWGTELRGYEVKDLLIEDRLSIQKEYFLAVTYDSAAKRALVIFCPEGGIDIEELAKTHPEKIIRKPFKIRKGFFEFHSRNMAISAGLKEKELLTVSVIMQRIGPALPGL